MSAGPSAPEGQALKAGETYAQRGVGLGVGPMVVGVDTQGVHAEIGGEEPEKTKWEEEREAKRAKARRKVVSAADIAQEKKIAERKEERTNKYDAGVSQVQDYFAEVFGSDPVRIHDALSAAGIDLQRGQGETPEQYARRAAEVVFHETRVQTFGDGAVSPEGKVGRGPQFKLKRQIASTRTAITMWREDMGDRLDTYRGASITAEHIVSQGRTTVEVPTEAIAAGVVAGGTSMQELLAGIQSGELTINPLEAALGRFVKHPAPEGANIPTQDAREMASRNIGEQVRDSVLSTVRGMGIPESMLPAIIGADAHISDLVEGLAGIASRTPEALYRAHESLLYLQALSDGLLKVSGGRLNLMLQLNKLVAERTKGAMSVSAMMEITRPFADAYLAAHPEEGISKLFADAKRDRIVQGGDTAVKRRLLQMRYSAARHDPLTSKVVRRLETKKGTRDVYAEGPEEESSEEEEKPEYIPKWWHLGKEAWDARAAHRAGKKQARTLQKVMTTAEGAAKEQARTRAEMAALSPADLANLARQRVAEPAPQPIAPEPGEQPPTPEELERVQRESEDAEVRAGQQGVDALTQNLLAEMQNPRLDAARVRELADQLETAGRELDELNARIEARRNPPAPEPVPATAAVVPPAPELATAPAPEPAQVEFPWQNPVTAPIFQDARAALNASALTPDAVDALRQRIANAAVSDELKASTNALLDDMAQRPGATGPGNPPAAPTV